MTNRSTLARVIAGSTIVIVACGVASCGSQATAPVPDFSASQAPAPGSQIGIHAGADTDYEQIVLAIDTQQLELSALAGDPARGTSDRVRRIAKESTKMLAPEAKELHEKLVADGDALDSHHSQSVTATSPASQLANLNGAAFDTAWLNNMVALNTAAISAAVTEMNLGEDRKTRDLARAKIDAASAQNAQLKRLL